MDNTLVAESKHYIYALSRTSYSASLVKRKLLSVRCVRGFLKHLPPILYLRSQCGALGLLHVADTLPSLHTLTPLIRAFNSLVCAAMTVTLTVPPHVAWWLVVIQDTREGLLLEIIFPFSRFFFFFYILIFFLEEVMRGNDFFFSLDFFFFLLCFEILYF